MRNVLSPYVSLNYLEWSLIRTRTIYLKRKHVQNCISHEYIKRSNNKLIDKICALTRIWHTAGPKSLVLDSGSLNMWRTYRRLTANFHPFMLESNIIPLSDPLHINRHDFLKHIQLAQCLIFIKQARSRSKRKYIYIWSHACMHAYIEKQRRKNREWDAYISDLAWTLVKAFRQTNSNGSVRDLEIERESTRPAFTNWTRSTRSAPFYIPSPAATYVRKNKK